MTMIRTHLYKALQESVYTFECCTQLGKVGRGLVTPLSHLVLVAVREASHQLGEFRQHETQRATNRVHTRAFQRLVVGLQQVK